MKVIEYLVLVFIFQYSEIRNTTKIKIYVSVLPSRRYNFQQIYREHNRGYSFLFYSILLIAHDGLIGMVLYTRAVRKELLIVFYLVIPRGTR
jgi:hypothetical protein